MDHQRQQTLRYAATIETTQSSPLGAVARTVQFEAFVIKKEHAHHENK